MFTARSRALELLHCRVGELLLARCRPVALELGERLVSRDRHDFVRRRAGLGSLVLPLNQTIVASD